MSSSEARLRPSHKREDRLTRAQSMRSGFAGDNLRRWTRVKPRYAAARSIASGASPSRWNSLHQIRHVDSEIPQVNLTHLVQKRLKGSDQGNVAAARVL